MECEVDMAYARTGDKRKIAPIKVAPLRQQLKYSLNKIQ